MYFQICKTQELTNSLMNVLYKIHNLYFHVSFPSVVCTIVQTAYVATLGCYIIIIYLYIYIKYCYNQ